MFVDVIVLHIVKQNGYHEKCNLGAMHLTLQRKYISIPKILL
jgi:hypothetical protein